MPTLYVRPDVWNNGIGQALCTEGLVRAAERGFRTLTLWVLVLNERAIRFYEAFGFVADGSIKREEATPERLEARRYVIDVPDHEDE
jgi:ribosomal protein S18 acetylase RimI-like enzyme